MKNKYNFNKYKFKVNLLIRINYIKKTKKYLIIL